MWGIAVSVGINLLSMGVSYLLGQDQDDLEDLLTEERRASLEGTAAASGDPIPVVYGSVGVTAKIIWTEPAASHEGKPLKLWGPNHDLPTVGGIPDPSSNTYSIKDIADELLADQFHAVLCQGPVDSVSRMTLVWDEEAWKVCLVTDSYIDDYHHPWDFEFTGLNAGTDHAIWIPEYMTENDPNYRPARFRELDNFGYGVDYTTGAPGQGTYQETYRAMMDKSVYADLYRDGMQFVGSDLNWPRYMDRAIIDDPDLVSGQVQYKGVVSLMGTVTGGSPHTEYRTSDANEFGFETYNDDVNPPREIRCRVRRQRTWNDWETSLADVGDDMNPVHVMYDLITCPIYGGNIDPAEIHEASFLDVATYAKSYGLGVSFQAEPADLSSHVDALCQIMDAVPFLHPETGQLGLSAAKMDDVSAGVFDDSNSSGEWVKETPKLSPTGLAITYRRRDLSDPLTRDKEKTLHYEYTALWQGAQSVLEKSYPMLREDSAALMRATKDFLYAQRHYTSISISIPWEEYPPGLRVGSAITWGSELQGAPAATYRITHIDLGDDTSAEVRIEGRSNWVDVDEPLWEPPPNPDRPEPVEIEVPEARAFVLPVHLARDLQPQLSQHAWATSEDAERTYAVAVLAHSEQSVSRMEAWRQLPGSSSSDPSDGYQLSSIGPHTPMRRLRSDLGRVDAVVALDGTLSPSEYRPGEELLILVRDEIIAATVSSSTPMNLTVVDRGVYDTVRPHSSHPDGTPVWVLSNRGERKWVPPRELISANQSYRYKARPVTPDGRTPPLSRLPDLTHDPQNGPIPRTYRPLPPGRLTASFVASNLSISWRYRSRTQTESERPGWNQVSLFMDEDAVLVVEIFGVRASTRILLNSFETSDSSVTSRNVNRQVLETEWTNIGMPGKPSGYVVNAWTYYDHPKYSGREARSLYTYEVVL